ncbi:helix-hairpin-helix domain-containing protein [Streptomyces sp. NRRL WC-3742]|uniref:helix-hairpin-helix domain-containing protein n=1 Tax=Streptomyces sp. NRRL WC-3742 TaxID=1463934 RepID=UPI00055D0615|nr:helix-hairpin-helix domain-containing protein [Streptomyces sp. NRRL WC-3742]
MSETGGGAPGDAEKAATVAQLAAQIREMAPFKKAGSPPPVVLPDPAADPETEEAAEAAEEAGTAGEAGGAVEPQVPAPAPAPAAPRPAAPAPAPAPARAAAPAPVDAGTLRAVAEVLAAGGAPADLAAPAVAALGGDAAELLREDPWAVLGLPGVRPEHADGFARGLLGAEARPEDPRRAHALVLWVLTQASLRGDSALELDQVTAELGRHRVPDPAAAIGAAMEDGQVLPFQEVLPGAEGRSAQSDDEEEVPTRTLLALEGLAMAEDSLAEKLLQLMATFVPGDGRNEDAGEDTGEDTGESSAEDASSDTPAAPGPAAWEAAAEAAPSPSAKALVRAVADAALVLHTGGEAARAEPAALLAAAAGLGLRACAATWTDQGRDSFAALAGPDTSALAPVLTLAELLSGTAGPGRAPDGTLALDLLVVLDAPLLDVELAATVLESLADGTRLVLSGDPGQLWSPGPGRFFADLLAAKVCPTVASRTPDFGPIGELVSGVGIGELQPVEAPDKEVVILTAKDGGEAVHRAIQLLTDSIPRALGIPAEQVVLITPGHGGTGGTRALNAAAKARLNPGPGRFGGFDPGDRVVDSPAPGLVRPARVLDGDATGLHLEYADGSRRTVPPAEVGRLRHGWALTVHQALGRRWPGAVVVLPEDAGPALTRQWVYTAFGRGERHLSVVHAAGPALAQAVAERPAQQRTTRLRAILAENAAETE